VLTSHHPPVSSFRVVLNSASLVLCVSVTRLLYGVFCVPLASSSEVSGSLLSFGLGGSVDMIMVNALSLSLLLL